MRITDWLLPSIALVLAGCASPPPPTPGLQAVARPDMPGLSSESPLETPRPSIDWTRGLSRLDVLLLARAQSPKILAIRRKLGVAQAGLVTAGTYPQNPTLDVDGFQNKLLNNEKEGSIGARLTQPIETGGQVQRRVDVAASERDITLAEIANEERLLGRDVSLAYSDLVYRTGRLALANASQERAKQVLEVATRRVAANDIPESEASLVRLEERQALVETDVAARERDAARLRLLGFLGEPRTRTFETSSSLATPSSASLVKSDLEARGLARRPDLFAAALAIERASRKRELARAEIWPTLGLSVSYARDVSFIRNHDLRDADDNLGLGISIPLPIFDRRQGPILEAAAERDRAEADLESQRNEVRREIALALNRVELGSARLALLEREIVPLAEKNLELSREAYRLGKSGTLEVLRAQDQLQKSQLARLDALHDYDQARIELAAASGEPLGE